MAHLDDEEIARRIERLPPKARQVFDCVRSGMLNGQIARQLGIAESTVKTSRRKLVGIRRTRGRLGL